MEELQKVCYEMRKNNIDIALLTSPCNILYLTGLEMPYYKTFMESIARDTPMAILLIDANNVTKKLIVSDFYNLKVKRSITDVDVDFFSSYDAFIERDPVQGLTRAVEEALSLEISSNAKVVIGIEEQTCPFVLTELIKHSFKNIKIKDVFSCLYISRRIKTPREIDLIKRAALLSDECQNTLLDIANETNPPEMTELDVWFRVQERIFKMEDSVIPFVGELVTGPRTGLNDYPLGPKNRIIEKGDSGIMDICPRYSGYWADCSNAVVFYDEPNAEQRRYFKAVRDAFEAAVDALLPGNRCCDVERAARKAFEANGFGAISYIGHGIGVEVNELPRITCYDNTIIEPNMVFCLEPQQYTGPSGKTGVRIEKMVLVTESGPEIINRFNWGM